MRTRTIHSHRILSPPGPFDFERGAAARILLVGIQGDVSPPLIFGDQLLQRMGVVCAGPERGELESESDAAVHIVPRFSGPERRSETQLPRLVRGEILRCERGAFYEHSRGRIRQLQRLVAGPRGEILELPTRSDAANEDDSERTAKPGPGFRALLPEPGERRIVAWGEFKELLGPQIAHRDRLRDSHQLSCDLQVYEVIAPQTLETLAARALGNASAASQLRPLTAELAQKLGVAAPVQNVIRAAAGILGRGEQFYCLRLAGDPTACPPTSNESGAATPPLAGVSRDPLTGKKAIPERFLKPWEFRFTRDEVLYDMNVVAAFQGRLAVALRRLARWHRWHSALRKWQVLLCGKNFDEQLWAVRPPVGGLTHSAVRQWAERTLELGGYEPRTMLLEWEVFWRRKGV